VAFVGAEGLGKGGGLDANAIACGLDVIQFVVDSHYLFVLFHYLYERLLGQILYLDRCSLRPGQIIFLLLLEAVSLIADLLRPQLLRFEVLRPIVFRD